MYDSRPSLKVDFRMVCKFESYVKMGSRDVNRWLLVMSCPQMTDISGYEDGLSHGQW